MRELDRKHLAYEMGEKNDHRSGQTITFREWYSLPHRPIWKLGWWDGYGDFCNDAKRIAQQEYDLRTPHDFMPCQWSNYSRNDWVLSFRLKHEGPSMVIWMPIDRIVHVPQSDKVFDRKYPYQAIQIWPLSRYPAPPFRIDKSFTQAFKKAAKEFGIETIKEWTSVKPSKAFIELIHKHL
jgi:hypothetical protein